MKIAFESQLFLKGNKTGIGGVADNIIKGLAQKEVCQCNFFSLGYSDERVQNVKKYEKEGVRLRSCGWFHDVLYKLIWPFIPLPYSLFFPDDVEITQFFNYVIPPFVRGKCVVMVYDMAYRVCPETVRLKTRKWLQLTLKRSCRRAAAIVTVSESSKRDIIKYLGVGEDKITVMPVGVDLKHFHNRYQKREIEDVKEKYHISGEYILYLGTLEPRKNIPKLIQAYKMLLDNVNGLEVPKLVIAGGRGWLYDSIFETVRDLKLDEKVLFTGYLNDYDVPKVMCGAKIFVFPSIYEGFGMPPLEAMACGTPVIVSNVSSLPEVVGEAGILVNPESAEEICHAMENVITDDGLYEDLVEKGLKHVQLYAWENSINILEGLYEKLVMG